MNNFDLSKHQSILQNIKNLYFKKKNQKDRLWQCAEYDFVYTFLKAGNDTFSKRFENYELRIKNYIQSVILGRFELNLDLVSEKLSGRILAFDVHCSMFDGLGKQETKGFVDACDTPPPEFWICYEDELLFSFIPDEFIAIVNKAMDVSMSESLEWYSDVIEI